MININHQLTLIFPFSTATRLKARVSVKTSQLIAFIFENLFRDSDTDVIHPLQYQNRKAKLYVSSQSKASQCHFQ